MYRLKLTPPRRVTAELVALTRFSAVILKDSKGKEQNELQRRATEGNVAQNKKAQETHFSSVIFPPNITMSTVCTNQTTQCETDTSR